MSDPKPPQTFEEWAKSKDESWTDFTPPMNQWRSAWNAAQAALRDDELGPLFLRDCARLAGLPDDASMDDIMFALRTVAAKERALRKRLEALEEELLTCGPCDHRGGCKIGVEGCTWALKDFGYRLRAVLEETK